VTYKHWNDPSRSLKVIDTGAIWQIVCHFLLVIRSNHICALHCFRGTATGLAYGCHNLYLSVTYSKGSHRIATCDIEMSLIWLQTTWH